MTDTTESLRHTMDGAAELRSVVRTMKALAASSITQYERAVRSLDEYYWTVQLSLVACLTQSHANSPRRASQVKQNDTRKTGGNNDSSNIGVVVFGSDQGLVGQFNETLAEFVANTLGLRAGKQIVWAVGERIYARLADSGVKPSGLLNVPNSVNAITALIGRILADIESQREEGGIDQVYLFHNRPKSHAVYEPSSQRLLPLDDIWRWELAELRWPSKNLPEVIGQSENSFRAFVSEYLFVSLFRACAESLASENASRLAAMQRAEKNIDELLLELNRTFNHLRQTNIDEELFDVISSYESLAEKSRATASS